MDQCKHCSARGDMKKCIEADCTIHESWYVMEHIKQLQNTSSNIDYTKCSSEIMDLVEACGHLLEQEHIEEVLKKHFA